MANRGGRTPLPSQQCPPASRRNKGGGNWRGRQPMDLNASASGPSPPAGTSGGEGVAEEDGGGARGGGVGGGSRRRQRQSQQQQQQQQPLPQQSTPNHPSQAQRQFQFQPEQLQAQFQAILQQLQRPHQQPMFLFKVDKSPASYNTKWGELHPDSQKCLLQIEERILEYKRESQRLDQYSRLFDSSICNKGFEPDATRIIQELRGMSIAIDREKKLVKKLTTSAKDMLRDTDLAIRSFMILCHRFFRPSATVTSNLDIGSQITRATSTFIAQAMASSIQAHDFYIHTPGRPSPFFTKTVDEFEKHLTECRRWTEESEQLIHLDTKSAFPSLGNLLECLPSVLSNIYGYFINAAAKVENLHQYIESMKTAYLADKRRRGDVNNPFCEADRQETAKREAAARRVHPTLHLPAISAWPSSQNAGMFASSATLGATTIPGGFPGSGYSVFSIPSSISASAPASSSLFSTPTPSAPTSTLFSSSVIAPQSTPCESTQPPSSSGVNSPAFISTPGIGGSSPHFSTPSSASGAAMGSGINIGATSTAPRPRSRGPKAARH